MKIVVTGGSGKVGAYLVPYLQKEHTVRVFDMQPFPDAQVESVQGNILDIADCEKAVDGMDMVVHMAATYNFTDFPPEKMIELNAMGTVNMLQATENKGVRRVVYVSTDSVLGFFWKTKDFLPEYLPMDEEHPCRPQDPYGVSKLMGEEACRSYTAKGTLDTVILRPCWIWFPEDIDGLRSAQEGYADKANTMWGHTHIDDFTRAVGMAVTSDAARNDCFFLISKCNFAGQPTAELIKEFYPALADGYADRFSSDEGLISGAKAEKVLGFTAEKSWKDIFTA